MIGARMCASDKCVQTFDAMCESIFDEEIQSAIGHGGLGAFAKNFKNFIGPKSAMFTEEDLKHPPTAFGQLQPCGAAAFSSHIDTFRDAVGVIMCFEANHFIRLLTNYWIDMLYCNTYQAAVELWIGCYR